VSELRLLRQALALGQHRNFRRAAESLRLSQPSLTRGIAALERSLGVTLFDRTRDGVKPTTFGRVLLDRAEVVLRAEANLRRDMQLLAGLDEGTLAVAAGPYPAEVSVAEAIGRLSRAHPRLRISCATMDPDQVVGEVLAERIDVGVAGTTGWNQDPRLVVEPLAGHRVYFACRPGHPLARSGRVSLQQTSQYPLAGVRLTGAQVAAALGRDPWVAQGQRAPQEVVPEIAINSLAVGRRIARHSDALVAATASLLVDDIRAGHLVALECDEPTLGTVYGIVYSRERTLSPVARTFVDMLKVVESEARVREVPAAFETGPHVTHVNRRRRSR